MGLNNVLSKNYRWQIRQFGNVAPSSKAIENKQAPSVSVHTGNSIKNVFCVCLGGGWSPTSWPHGEPAGDLQNPKYPCWNTGASGRDVIDGIRRQRPHLHLHLPVHLQSLRQHTDCPAAAAGQVSLKKWRFKTAQCVCVCVRVTLKCSSHLFSDRYGSVEENGQDVDRGYSSESNGAIRKWDTVYYYAFHVDAFRR